jgi:hypothetical protein
MRVERAPAAAPICTRPEKWTDRLRNEETEQQFWAKEFNSCYIVISSGRRWLIYSFIFITKLTKLTILTLLNKIKNKNNLHYLKN